MRTLGTIWLTLALAGSPAAAKNLEVYFIDVEGGQATLFVAPSGESMLVDAGWPGNNNRDADRIAAAAKKAGVKRIDYFVATHFHLDHIGGVPQLAAKLPIRNFVDHGQSVETGKNAEQLFAAYADYRSKGNHIVVKPGDTIPVKGLDIQVVSAAGNLIANPLPGAGQPNPFCEGFKERPVDKSENAQSVGMLITYGKFRMIDLGDLTWNKERELVCPDNKVGTVDAYVVTHHGMNLSGSPAIVHALHAKVAIMDNGAKKGGTPEAWQTIHTAPGLEDIWQLHYSIAGAHEHNAPDAFIANTDSTVDAGNYIRLTVLKDGSYTVYNSRNKYSKTYAAQ